MAVYHSYHGNKEKAIKEMELFSKETKYQYLILPLLKIDPLIDNVKDDPEFQKIIKEMETRFWENHQRIRESLEEKGLL